MRRMLLALALAAAAALGLLEVAWGQTFPRDDTGAVAPACVWRTDSTGTYNTCSDANPLPTSSAGQLPATSDPTGWGRRIFNDGTFSPAQSTAGAWLDDQTLIGIGGATGVGATFTIFRSGDRGVTWGSVGTVTTATTAPPVTAILQIAGTNLWLVSGQRPAGSFALMTGGLGGPFTGVPGASGATLVETYMPVQQGGTIIVVGGASAGNGFVCRSINNMASVTCAQPAGITAGFSGTSSGTQRLASPSLNIWLALGNGRQVFRSTDDGVTWTTAQTLTGQDGLSSITCVSATVCVATTTAVTGVRTNVFRSTDAGLTWTQVHESILRVVGLLNYGQGVVVGVYNSTNFATSQGIRSADSGVTWAPLPSGTAFGDLTNPTGLVTRAGRAVITGGLAAGNVTHFGFYTVALGAGETGITGPNGVRWDINNLGHGGVYQGSAAASTGSWPVTNVQGPTLFNSETTGAANTAVVVTVSAVANVRAHLYRLDARCSAGTSSLTVQDGATTIWSTVAAAITAAQFATTWAPGLTGTTNTAMIITLATCGVGNTGTLTVQADRF